MRTNFHSMSNPSSDSCVQPIMEKQKIKVNIFRAANDQWPRVFETRNEAMLGNAQWIVERVGESSVVSVIGNSGIWIEHASFGLLEASKGASIIGFDTMYRFLSWWSSPQPIVEGANQVAIGILSLGEAFTFEGSTYRISETNDMNPRITEKWGINQLTSVACGFNPRTLVTPFKGTINIKVE